MVLMSMTLWWLQCSPQLILDPTIFRCVQDDRESMTRNQDLVLIPLLTMWWDLNVIHIIIMQFSHNSATTQNFNGDVCAITFNHLPWIQTAWIYHISPLALPTSIVFPC